MRYEEVNSLAEQVRRKWNPILEHPDLTPINDTYKKNVTAILLENQEQYLSETPTNSGMQQGMISVVTLPQKQVLFSHSTQFSSHSFVDQCQT